MNRFFSNPAATPIMISALMAVGILITLFACQPDATPKAKESKGWLDKFYMHYAIRGAWEFFGSQAKDKNVIVEINVPERQAQDLMNLPDDQRTALIAHNTCPPKDQDIWRKLDVDGDIIIHTRLNGNIFAEVRCRNN